MREKRREGFRVDWVDFFLRFFIADTKFRFLNVNTACQTALSWCRLRHLFCRCLSRAMLSGFMTKPEIHFLYCRCLNNTYSIKPLNSSFMEKGYNLIKSGCFGLCLYTEISLILSCFDCWSWLFTDITAYNFSLFQSVLYSDIELIFGKCLYHSSALNFGLMLFL